jgi:ferredoxin
MDILDSLDLTLRALNTRIPEVDPQRCVVTRYQSSSCRRCVRVCPGNAITPTPLLEVDPQQCLGCGACAVVCPTGALDFAQPRNALRAGLRAAAGNGRPTEGFDDPTAVTIACTRGRLSAGEGKGIRVECLGSVAAGDLLLAWARGVDAIYLVDGGCDGCRLQSAASELPQTIAAAESLMSMTVTRLTSIGHPDKTPAHEGARSTGPVLSRRQFLLFFGLRSAKLVETSATKPDHSVKALHAQKEPPLTHRLLRETLATTTPRSAEDGLDGSAASATSLIEQLHLARVTVGPTCDGCGLCMRYCPHGALKERGDSVVADPARCTACGLCAEVCPVEALRLEAPDLL